jgi:dihydrofolate reductase
MRRLTVFNSISLDGFFSDVNGDMSFAHQSPDDVEWNEFVAGNASGGGMMVFGRITYELMLRYWPTPMAMKDNPVVAESMGAMPKLVFSRTLASSDWRNTRFVKGDPAAEIRALKAQPGKDMAILGSGTIVSQLAEAHLVDEFQVVVLPVVLGKGRSMFDGVKQTLHLKLASSRTFRNGNVLMCYTPGG